MRCDDVHIFDRMPKTWCLVLLVCWYSDRSHFEATSAADASLQLCAEPETRPAWARVFAPRHAEGGEIPPECIVSKAQHVIVIVIVIVIV
eukprot:COSAG02_NODE_4272_length_5563_cov_1.811310_3_plen_90_part_00